MTPVRPLARRRYRRRTVRVSVVYRSAYGCARALATTLGAGGMFIATEEPLPKHMKLEVDFALPEHPEQQHRIPATVVWCNSPKDAQSHALGMGISFDDPRACATLAVELERD